MSISKSPTFASAAPTGNVDKDEIVEFAVELDSIPHPDWMATLATVIQEFEYGRSMTVDVPFSRVILRCEIDSLRNKIDLLNMAAKQATDNLAFQRQKQAADQRRKQEILDKANAKLQELGLLRK